MKHAAALSALCVLLIAVGRSDGSGLSNGSRPPAGRLRVKYVPFEYYGRSSESDFAECIPDSSDDFPPDLFTDEQKRHGAVILHFLFGVYCFALLAVVCNDYFLPCVEAICERMNLSQDVGAATVMAFATSAPELCVNLIGTFITESDIGIGTVVGSAMFNTLGVAALGGLATSKYIDIAWGPLTRDTILYIVTIALFISMCWDGRIYWYETVILMVFYVCYLLFMWSNKSITRHSRRLFGRCCSAEKRPGDGIITDSQLSAAEKCEADDAQAGKQLWRVPAGSRTYKAWFVFSWPLRLVLYYTIPNPKRWPCGLFLAFAMCVFWIGVNSYLVSWMITVIGSTLGVADFVMGLTLLAAGGCLPEATSIVIVSMKGQGGMGVSNSLGANIQDILLALGLPWFVKSMIQLRDNEQYIDIGSKSLVYTILALVLAVLALYTTIALNGYRLSRRVGFVLISVYAIFLTAAILLETFVLKKHLPRCK